MNPTQNTRSQWANFFAIAFVAVFCVAWFVRFEWQMLTEDFWYNDDNAQHVAWMWKWKANHFAENDLMNQAAERMQPIGYKALAWLAMRVMNPMQFGKYMAVLTLLSASFFAFFLLKKRLGLQAALAAAVLVGFLSMERMVGFNARALGFPLILAFLYFLVEKKWLATAICLLLSVNIYPVSFLMELGILALEGGRWAISMRQNTQWFFQVESKKIGWMLGAVPLAVLAGYFQSNGVKLDPNLGPMFSKSEMLTLPKFGDGGRVNFRNEVPSFTQVFQVAFPDSEYMWPIVAICFLIFLAELIKQRHASRLDRLIFYLPVVGIGLYLIGRLLLPALFLPNRYLTYTYPIFFSLLMARLVGIYAEVFKKWWATALLLALLVLPRFLSYVPHNNAQYNYGGYAGLFQKINELPNDHGLIAGPTYVCDMIPMHCQRSVLFSQEGFHALYFKHYWEKMAPRLYDYMDATTTNDPELVKDFVRKYQVSYLILDRKLVEEGQPFPSFEPFNAYLKDKLDKNSERDFAIAKFPKELYTEVEKYCWILDCRQWLRQER